MSPPVFHILGADRSPRAAPTPGARTHPGRFLGHWGNPSTDLKREPSGPLVALGTRVARWAVSTHAAPFPWSHPLAILTGAQEGFPARPPPPLPFPAPPQPLRSGFSQHLREPLAPPVPPSPAAAVPAEPSRQALLGGIDPPAVILPVARRHSFPNRAFHSSKVVVDKPFRSSRVKGNPR